MKRIYIALALLIVIGSLCVYEQLEFDRVYSNICEKLDEVSEYAQDDNFEDAYKICCELDVYFQKEYKVLSLMLYNHKLNEFHLSIHELKGFAENKDKTLLSKVLFAKVQAEQLKTNQKINLQNIL